MAKRIPKLRTVWIITVQIPDTSHTYYLHQYSPGYGDVTFTASAYDARQFKQKSKARKMIATLLDRDSLRGYKFDVLAYEIDDHLHFAKL